jgi:hypothetical protein
MYLYVTANPIKHIDHSGTGLLDRVKSSVSAGISRAEAAVKPGGAVFEAVDSAFNSSKHDVSAAVLNNMASRGEDLVKGTKEGLKQAGGDLGDIAYGASHMSDQGAKQKLNTAIENRQLAPIKMAAGAAVGFAHLLKNVGQGLGTVAYYRPELLGVVGTVLPSHSKEVGADAKVASAVTDIVLDAPQIILTVEGGVSSAKGLKGLTGRTPLTKGTTTPFRDMPKGHAFAVKQYWKKFRQTGSFQRAGEAFHEAIGPPNPSIKINKEMGAPNHGPDQFLHADSPGAGGGAVLKEHKTTIRGGTEELRQGASSQSMGYSANYQRLTGLVPIRIVEIHDMLRKVVRKTH